MENSVTPAKIQDIIEQCEWEVFTVFEKCTVVSCKLPNGFVLTESSACADPKNYSPELGTMICKDRITNKIWELEGYRLQCQLGK